MVRCKGCGGEFESLDAGGCGRCRSKSLSLSPQSQAALLDSTPACVGCGEVYPYMDPVAPGARPRCNGCRVPAPSSHPPAGKLLPNTSMSLTAHTNNFGLFQSPNPPANPPARPSAGTAVSDMLHILDGPLNARNPGQLTDRVVARGEELNPPVPGSSQYSHDLMARSQQGVRMLTDYPSATPLETNMTRRPPLPKSFKQRVPAQRGNARPTRPAPPTGIFVAIRDIVFKGVRSPPPFDPTGVSSQSFAASTPWNDILNWLLGQGVTYTSDRYLYTILPEDVHRDIALLLFNTSTDKGQMPHRLTPVPGSSHVTLGQFFMYHGFGPLDMEHFGHFLHKNQALIGRLEVRLQINMNEEELEKAMLAAASAGPSAVPRSPVKSSRRGTKRKADVESDGAQPEEDEHLNGRTRRTSPFEPYRVTAWRVEIHVHEEKDDDDDSNTLAQIICLEQEGDAPFDVCVSREPIMSGTRLNTYRLKNDSTRVEFDAKRFSNFGCRPPVTIETNYQELCNEMTCREMFQQTVSSFFRELGGCSLYSSTFELAPFMLYKVTEGKDCGLAWIVDPVLKKDPTRIGLLLCALEPNRGILNSAVQTFAALAHYSFAISRGTWVIAAAQAVHTPDPSRPPRFLIQDVRTFSDVAGNTGVDDEGLAGIERFRAAHTCNDLCSVLKLSRIQ